MNSRPAMVAGINIALSTYEEQLVRRELSMVLDAWSADFESVDTLEKLLDVLIEAVPSHGCPQDASFPG